MSDIRILFIEDNPLDAELMARRIKKDGLDISYQIVGEFAEIDSMVSQHETDIIICDYNLPGYTGVQALNKIKSIDVDIPVILVSGAIPDETAIEAVLAGAKDYVLKDNLIRLVPAIKREYDSLVKLREKQHADLLLNSLFESQIGILISDKDKNITQVNEFYCQMLGYTKEEFEKLTLANIFPEESRNAILEQYENFIEGGTNEIYEIKNLTKNGIELSVIATSKKVTTFNSTYVISTVLDITDRKRIEKEVLTQNAQLTQLTETREKLYAIIGHDLKNALFGISGILGFMIDEVDRNETTLNSIQEKMILLHASSENATRLLDNLLDWVQIQADNLHFETSEYNVSDQISGILKLLKAQATNKQIELIGEVGEDISIQADKNMLATVFRNLISNGIKFTKPGGFVKISVEERDSELIFVIQDNGIGIPPKVAQNLFDPANRPKRVGTNREMGTGLGMILVQEMIDFHDGVITFTTVEEKGSTFVITLPK
tara:strand:+ start:10494 stop:11966 length:1473 start_codon:yes stop_codon:yes gene_type:complete